MKDFQTNECRVVQQILLETSGQVPSREKREFIERHINQCPECQAFASLINQAPELLHPEHAKWVPRISTRKRLLEAVRGKSSPRKPLRWDTFRHKLSALLHHPVPVYQLLLALGILLVGSLLLRSFFPHASRQPIPHKVVATSKLTLVGANGEQQPVDIRELYRPGLSVGEDTVMIRFLINGM